MSSSQPPQKKPYIIEGAVFGRPVYDEVLTHQAAMLTLEVLALSANDIEYYDPAQKHRNNPRYVLIGGDALPRLIDSVTGETLVTIRER